MLDLLRPLAVFTVVAETRSFRAAADRLGLSPSVVSHHVSKLEERYDVALLYRSTRKLKLTAAGQEVLEYGKALTEAGLSAQDVLQVDLAEPQGLLRVAAPAILEHGRFMDDVAQFLEIYPNIELQLHFSDERIDIIGEGYDLALRAGKLEDSDLVVQKLTSVEDVICAAPSFIEKYGEPSTPHELPNFRMIGVPSSSDSLDFKSKAGSMRGVRVHLAPVIRVNTGDAALSLAFRGSGIARLPRLLIESRTKGELVDLLQDWELPRFNIQAVWPKNVGRRSLTRLFVEHVQKILKA